MNLEVNFRDLTIEEGYARGLITTIIQPVKDIIFDNVYMKNRNETPLKLDSITYIPHTTIQYDFDQRISSKFNGTSPRRN